MGLQTTAATKRKHEITFDSKDAKVYTNCPPPVKTSRWSAPRTNNNSTSNYNELTITSTTVVLCNSSSTNINGTAIVNKKTWDDSKISVNCNNIQATTINNDNHIDIANGSTYSEDSIAKLEVVAVSCEPWSTPEPVDCISKLQAVAVPTDPWGSISTRSTLATTLLSPDELDDDDDDFEDDYEEEESIIPTYCPLRYHPCPPATGSSSSNNINSESNCGGNPSGIQRSYSPAHNYNTRPNYYSEPFPQQNCSRTGNQHLRMVPSSNGFSAQWGNSAGQNGFYVPPEAAYLPPQQTIRCAENGKSYLELGCSPASFSMTNPGSVGMLGINSNTLDARHPLKRCCDGRAGTWCNTNKNCYKDVRIKIRNLSMFKLSRFRQVSEQSLHRSVLICNTLKYIDKEIESEVKEMHQQQHHLSHHSHQSNFHHHIAHNGSPHNHHHNNNHSPPPPQHTAQQNPQHPLQSNGGISEYSPAMGSARVTNIDYHQHQQQHQQQQQPNQFHSHPQITDNRNRDCTQLSSYMSVMSKSSLFNTQTSHHQHQQSPTSQHQRQMEQQLQQQQCNNRDSIHPYDHYPFRETQSGRATPFPSAPSPHIAATTSLVNSTTLVNDHDSDYSEDESNRAINWSSVLSLSSQSDLDPLNNNDLFTILPPATSSTSPPAAIPVPLSIAISGTFTATSVQSSSNTGSISTLSPSVSTSSSGNTSSTPTTFTTLSTISSSTYSLTSSSTAAASLASAAATATASSWEYGLLDMEFGLGSEFTELVPTCKLSSDDLFKSVSPVSVLSASRYSSVHDNDLDQPAHIMVGS